MSVPLFRHCGYAAPLARSNGSPVVRARLDAVERDKLDLYQQRDAEHVRVAEALQALTT